MYYYNKVVNSTSAGNWVNRPFESIAQARSWWERNEIKESGCSSSPSTIAPALKTSDISQLKSLACLEYKVDSRDNCSKSQESTPASQIQCEDVASVPVTVPQSQKQNCDQSIDETSQLLMDNERLSLAISGQDLQSVDESQSKITFHKSVQQIHWPLQLWASLQFCPLWHNTQSKELGC